MNISTQNKITLGSVLGTFGALGIVLLLILGEPAELDPWFSLLAFLVGMLAGVGATLGITGLIERRRNP